MKALAVVILLALVLLSLAAVLLMLAAIISRVRRRKSGQKRSSGKDRRARGMSVPYETLAEYYGGIDKTSGANLRKLFEEGLSLKQKGDFRQAVKVFGQCLNGNLTAYEKTGVLLTLGNCHFAAEEWDQTREYYEKARSLARDSGNERARLSTLLNLGLLSAVDRKWDKAIKNYRDAIDLDRSLGFAEGEAIDLNTLALLYENKRDSKSALIHYNGSIEIFRKLKDVEKTELVENNIRRLKKLATKTQDLI